MSLFFPDWEVISSCQSIFWFRGFVLFPSLKQIIWFFPGNFSEDNLKFNPLNKGSRIISDFWQFVCFLWGETEPILLEKRASAAGASAELQVRKMNQQPAGCPGAAGASDWLLTGIRVWCMTLKVFLWCINIKNILQYESYMFVIFNLDWVEV